MGKGSPGAGVHRATLATPAVVTLAVHHPGSDSSPLAVSRRTIHPMTTSGFQLPTWSRTVAESFGDVNFAITSAQENQGGPSCHTRANTVVVSMPGAGM